jgi:hypothetical protein
MLRKPYHPRRSWLPRLLFLFTLGVSALLFLLVFLSPLLDNGQVRVLALFARDAAVRRTAVASALGLAVTASVFFRPGNRLPPLPRRVKPSRRPPPPAGAGA